MTSTTKTKTVRPKPWGVLFLPDVLDKDGKSNEKFYQTHAQVRNAVQTKLDDLGQWCNRYNKAGVEALDAVRRQVNELEGDFDRFGESERQIVGVFDEHTGTAVRIKIRRMAL